MKDSRINIRISKSKHLRLKTLAEDKGKSVTTIIEECIDRVLKRNKK